MDAIDRQLVAELHDNARATWAELGRLVGMSGPSVQERVRRLEERGVISGYRAEVSAEAVGLGVSALVDLYQRDEVPTEEVADQLRAIPEVEDCWYVAGDEEFVVKVRAQDVAGPGGGHHQASRRARGGPHPHDRGPVDVLGGPWPAAAGGRPPEQPTRATGPSGRP